MEMLKDFFSFITSFEVKHIIVVTIIFIILVVFSLFGNLVIDLGKKKLSIGKSNKISCKDCLNLLLARRIQYETIYYTTSNKILRDQMNFAEHKLHIVKNLLIEMYRRNIKQYNNLHNPDEEKKEVILYKELVSSALREVKDEIRRSYKDNGFDDLDSKALDDYIKDRYDYIDSLFRSYLTYNYPNTMMIPLDEKLRIAEIEVVPEFKDIIKEIYVNAKDVRLSIEKQLEDLQKQFIDQLDKVVLDHTR